MRILIVNSGLRYGGAETQIIELSKEMARRNNAVTIYTLTNDVPRLAELEGTGVKVIVDNKRGRLDLGVLRRLRRHMRQYRPDVIHGFLFDGNFYSRVAAVGLGIPVLSSERNDNYSLRPSQVWPHRLTRHLADGVVANTWAGRDFAQRLFGLPDSHMHVVWNGVRLADIDARVAEGTRNYRELFFSDAEVRVACLVGTIIPSKDYLLALDAADRLTRLDSRWRVLFIGDTFQQSLSYQCDYTQAGWNYRRQVTARFDALGLAGRAHFAGQRDDALQIMAQCDVLFSTSRHEGFPNVVLEAMSVGLPAVAVAYSDIRRILPQPWQVVDREPEAIARTILRAAAERDQVAPLQREWVCHHATIERAAESLQSVYRQYAEDAA